MPYAFAITFLAGIAFTVVTMIAGVERAVPAADPAAPRPVHARIGRPAVGAFFIGLGATGYLLTRFTTLGPWTLFGSALAGGAVLCGIALALIAGWAVPSARREKVDERFTHQGVVGRVVTPITASGLGAIMFSVDGRPRQLAARALDGSALGAGVEIVIERIEDGVAWVEPWDRVEGRL